MITVVKDRFEKNNEVITNATLPYPRQPAFRMTTLQKIENVLT